MKSILNECVEKIKKNRHRFHKYTAIIAVLALITVVGVNVALRQDGISMSADSFFGIAETDEDPEVNADASTTADSDSSDASNSTDAGESTETTSESTDSDQTQDSHVSDDGDSTDGKTKAEKLSDGDASAETDKLVDDSEDSQETKYSDDSADVESKSTWEKTIPSGLTGVWSEDLVKVAKSQIGYKESTKNFRYSDDGSTKQGYTRYGAWYGNKYGDWSAMFAAFCLHYADISDSYIPVNSGVSAWKVNLKKEDLYQAKGDYTPVAGDIVFLDNDSDGTDDHAAIIVSTSDSGFEAVEGDLDGAVAKKSFTSDDKTISGYLVLPENPDQDQATATTSLDQEDTDSSDSDGTEDAEEVEGDDDGILAASDSVNYQDMKGNITSVSGAGTKYNGSLFETSLTLNFQFKKSDVQANGYNYKFNYPEGIMVPEGKADLVLGQEYPLYDSANVQAGTYGFLKNDDGTYAVFIHLDKDYVDGKAGDTLEGHVTFQGTMDKSGSQDDGSYKKKFSDSVTLDIPASEIDFPDNSTGKFDITSTKDVKYDSQTGKLTYTVTITSQKGTPGTVNFVDTVTTTGMSLGTPDVTVIKRNDQGTEEDVAVSNKNYSNNTLTMDLPQMAANSSYTVTYVYDVSNLQGDVSTAHNKVTVKSTNNKVTITDKAEKDYEIKNKCDITKSGQYEKDTNRIKWTITLNNNHSNIAGSTLSDDMLSQLVPFKINDSDTSTVNVKVTTSTDWKPLQENDGWQLIWENGKATGIRFTEVENGRNTRDYTIVYYTSYDGKASFTTDTVTNTAVFKPSNGSSEVEGTGTANVSDGDVTKAHGDATVDTNSKTAIVPWTVTITIPKSGLLSGTVITDNSIKDSWNNTYGTQYLTQKQVVEWANGICWKDESGNKQISSASIVSNPAFTIKFTDINGTSYSYDEIASNANGKFNDSKFTLYTITLNSDVALPDGAKKLVFAYNTTADLSAATGTTEVTYRNTVTVGDKSANADYKYKQGFIKMDGGWHTGTTQADGSSKKLTWILQANLINSSNKITFIDNLPEGVVLESVKVGDLNNQTLTPDDNGNISGSYNSIEAKGTYTSNKLMLTLTNTNAEWTQGSSHEITLYCSIDTDKIQNYEAGKTYTFKNEASATDNSGTIGSDTQTQEWTEKTDTETKKTVDKSGSWDNNTRQMNYTVKINPDGKDLLEGSDQLNLTDEFIYQHGGITAINDKTGERENVELTAWVLPDSVKLYKAELVDGAWVKGDEVTTWSWKVATSADQWNPYNHSVITATGVPDSTPLILEYTYQYYLYNPDTGYTGYSNANKVDKLSNTLKIDGTSESGTSERNDFDWKQQTHAASVVTEKSYTIYKVDSADYGKYLKGAKFKLQYYQDGTYIDAGYTYTTNSNGVIQVAYQKDTSDSSQYQFSENTLYRLVEIQAPDNYNLPDDPVNEALYFYFGNSSKEVSESSLPSTLPSNTFDLNQSAHVAYVENESKVTELSVDKRWFKKDGTEVTNKKQGAISFDLYRTESGSGAVLSGSLTQPNGDPLDIGSGTYTAGSTVTYCISASYTDTNKESSLPTPEIFLNGTSVKCEVYSDDVENNDGKGYISYTHNYKFTYSFTLKSGENVLSGGRGNVSGSWNWCWTYDSKATITRKQVEDYKVGTYTISSDNNWRCTISNLPSSEVTTVDGKNVKVYYKYYVVENEVSHYNTTYDNNDGVSSGLITIKNTNQQEESYALPEAGGGGTTLYTTVGIILMGIALLYGIFMRYRRRRGEV